MSADSETKSIVSRETQNELRSIVVDGLLEFLDVTRSGLLQWFKGFEDLEVAVNKDSLISDNCKALCDYEMALLVRMTEVFKDEHSSRQPRSILFGIVLMKLGKPPNESFNVRLWEAFKPAWKDGDPELNTQEDIAKITSELMLSMYKVCDKRSTNPPASPQITMITDKPESD
jgi:hypothetical protein